MSPPELQNERERSGKTKRKSFSSANPREGKANNRTREKTGKGPAFNTLALKGKRRPQDAKNSLPKKRMGKKVAEPHISLANH